MEESSHSINRTCAFSEVHAPGANLGEVVRCEYMIYNSRYIYGRVCACVVLRISPFLIKCFFSLFPPTSPPRPFLFRSPTVRFHQLYLVEILCVKRKKKESPRISCTQSTGDSFANDAGTRVQPYTHFRRPLKSLIGVFGGIIIETFVN